MIKAQFSLSGDVKHSKTLGALDESDPEVYTEEISGASFSLSAPGLEPGAYTIEIDLIESVLEGQGRRVMDILCGQVVLARDLDIFRRPEECVFPMACPAGLIIWAMRSAGR